MGFNLETAAYWAIFIFICVVLMAMTFVIPVDAYCEATQGSTVYLGETCDITRVVGWQQQFAYFYEGYPVGTPDIIANAEGFQHKYYIDPKIFVPGLWYKWDGEIEHAGNMDAFWVVNGTRPVVVDNTTTPVVLTPENPNATIVTAISKTKINIARGESLNYIYRTNEDKGKAWVWIFDASTKYLGMPMTNNGTYYNYVFTTGLTQTLSPRTYRGYLQFAGGNNKQDVFYSSENTIDSVYKDVPRYNLSDITKPQYEAVFLNMTADKNYSDDYIVPFQITVKDVIITIREYYPDGNMLVVAGTTTLSSDTTIKCIIDPDHWTTARDKTLNTYTVVVTGDIDDDRQFKVMLPLKWDELSIGEHIIRLSVDEKGIKYTAEKEFRITDTFVMPTPTPATVKMVMSDAGFYQVTPTPTPKPSPMITCTPAPTPVPTPTSNITTNITPTVNATPTKQPTPTPIPTPTTYVVPMFEMMGILAVAFAFAIWRMK